MNVLAFSSESEMKTLLANAAAHGLHPEQEALSWGSTWVQFYDIGKHHIRFGLVLSKDTLIDLALESGCTSEQARDQVAAAERAQGMGVLYSRYYDFWRRPDGIHSVTYKAHVWPIEESLYHQASEADWYISQLPTSGQVNLQAAWMGFRAHVKERQH